jgi:hypothetical protein
MIFSPFRRIIIMRLTTKIPMFTCHFKFWFSVFVHIYSTEYISYEKTKRDNLTNIFREIVLLILFNFLMVSHILEYCNIVTILQLEEVLMYSQFYTQYRKTSIIIISTYYFLVFKCQPCLQYFKIILLRGIQFTHVQHTCTGIQFCCDITRKVHALRPSGAPIMYWP